MELRMLRGVGPWLGWAADRNVVLAEWTLAYVRSNDELLSSRQSAEILLLPPIRQPIPIRIDNLLKIKPPASLDLALQTRDDINAGSDTLNSLKNGFIGKVHGRERNGPGDVGRGHRGALQILIRGIGAYHFSSGWQCRLQNGAVRLRNAHRWNPIAGAAQCS